MKISIWSIIFTTCMLIYNLTHSIVNALNFNGKFTLVYAVFTLLISVLLTFLVDSFVKELKNENTN